MNDFHVHTSFCDGKNSPEEVICSAIKLNMKKIGLVYHSYVPFDEEFCIKKGNEKAFSDEIDRMREKYRGKIEILKGVEKDYFSDTSDGDCDYAIGSVHYIKIGGEYFSVDESAEKFESLAKDKFGGDYYAFAEEYFNLVSDVVNKTNADIIGHFDLISKFNEGGRFFDENNERYKKCAYNAIEKLVKYNVPFEINTGAILRGYRKTPYPNADFIRKIESLGGKFILSSDAHSAENMCFGFDGIKINNINENFKAL